MTKLDGNERWNSKMLLTEHQEQYDSRKEPPKKSGGHPTPDEMEMIRDAILLPHMLTMAQRSIDESKLSGNFLSQLHIAAAQALMDMITKDLYALRRELSQRRIKILSDEQVDLVVYHRYICRGYEERFGIVREVMRAEIGVKFGGYMAKIKNLYRELNRKGTLESNKSSNLQS